MALTVNFGNGGTSSAVTLADADAQTGGLATNGGEAGTQDITNSKGKLVGEVLNDTDPVAVAAQPQAVKVPGGGTGTGGTVDISYENGAFNFDVAGTWNSVKNAEASLTGNAHGERVVFSDFVHVDLNFANQTSLSDITVENVKRVNVNTGIGDDSVKITLSSNSNDWQNVANVSTGVGNDSIKIGAGDVVNGAKFTDGRYTTLTVDAGAGNDSIDLSGLNLKSSTIIGGTGTNTVMLGNSGVDKILYTKGEDLSIFGFETGKDVFDLRGQATIANTSITGDTTVLTTSDGHTITFHGGSPVLMS